MSMYQGVYVGIGYLVDAEQRVEMLDQVQDFNCRDEISTHFHRIDVCYEKYFFGKIIYEIPEGKAVSIETLAALPGLTDDGSFGIKYGSMLYDMGIPVEEINTTWGKPNIYIVHWEDC